MPDKYDAMAAELVPDYKPMAIPPLRKTVLVHSLEEIRTSQIKNIADAIRSAVADAVRERTEACAKKLESLYQKIDGPGWLANDIAHENACQHAVAIRSLATEDANP